MKDFMKLPKQLAIAGLVFNSLLLLGAVALYFGADSAAIKDYLEKQADANAGASQALRDLMLPFIFIIFVPWLLNLLGILYLNRYIVASAVMFIISGLLMLYTVIIPILLITSGTMLLLRHRHYVQHEKYKAP